MAQSDESIEQVNRAMAYGALGFGVAAIVAPRGLRRLYGMDADSSELTYFGRMWGTRTAVIGALAMAAADADDDMQRRLATLSAGMNGLDALTAATTRGLPARARVMGAVTSGAFAVAAAYAATAD